MGVISARWMDRMDGAGSGAATELGGGEYTILNLPMGTDPEFGQ
jgi:hypothetical protein